MTVTTAAIDPSPRTTAHVRVIDLSVSLASSDVPVVDKVSFELGRGQVLGLVGESGSGKTTAGLALMGYARRGLRISGGSVCIGDRDILALSAAELEKVRGCVVAYVPQDPASALDPAMKLGAQLREIFAAHPDCLPAGTNVGTFLLELLEEVRLPDPKRVLNSYPHQLSGGQQQRVGIAMAFAARPELIVFDEPTTGLDVSTQRHFLDTVRQLAAKTGVAAVYVSHDLPVVADIADQTAVMYAGRIVEYGPTQALFDEPKHPYTAGLCGAIPSTVKTTELVGIPGQPPRPGQWPAGCAFADRCPAVTEECRAKVPDLLPAEESLVRCIHAGTVSPPAGRPLAASVLRDADAALSCRDLTACYGSRTVLRGVDFTLRTGTCLAVVGESGSGKTTLARCLIGLHENWSGTVQFDGDALDVGSAKRTDAQRRAMQYIFQSPYNSLNPRKTIGEILEAPLKLFFDYNRSDRLGRINDTLSAVSLGPAFLNKFPHQLSGGERQRVSLGRALVVEPTLLICDEITSALDVSVQASIVEELRALQAQRNLSLLFITHNLAVVRSIAQEVMVLDGGVIVECGSTDQVLDTPSHPYTQQLLADIPQLRASA
jgi:peptide/nickel transport system ATP-binding protein